MFLTRLIYASRISDAFITEDLSTILEQSNTNNKINRISGLLYFNRNYFMQCIEGDRTDVNNTYFRIVNDPRHQNVTLLEFKDIITREFDDWSMAYVPETAESIEVFQRFSNSAKFEPHTLLSNEAFKMMLALKDLVKLEETSDTIA